MIHKRQSYQKFEKKKKVRNKRHYLWIRPRIIYNSRQAYIFKHISLFSYTRVDKKKNRETFGPRSINVVSLRPKKCRFFCIRLFRIISSTLNLRFSEKSNYIINCMFPLWTQFSFHLVLFRTTNDYRQYQCHRQEFNKIGRGWKKINSVCTFGIKFSYLLNNFK